MHYKTRSAYVLTLNYALQNMLCIGCLRLRLCGVGDRALVRKTGSRGSTPLAGEFSRLVLQPNPSLHCTIEEDCRKTPRQSSMKMGSCGIALQPHSSTVDGATNDFCGLTNNIHQANPCGQRHLPPTRSQYGTEIVKSLRGEEIELRHAKEGGGSTSRSRSTVGSARKNIYP